LREPIKIEAINNKVAPAAISAARRFSVSNMGLRISTAIIHEVDCPEKGLLKNLLIAFGGEWSASFRGLR
jgi:hypothetical protein